MGIFSHYDSSHVNFNDSFFLSFSARGLCYLLIFSFQCKINVYGFLSSLCKINNNISNNKKAIENTSSDYLLTSLGYLTAVQH